MFCYSGDSPIIEIAQNLRDCAIFRGRVRLDENKRPVLSKYAPAPGKSVNASALNIDFHEMRAADTGENESSVII